MKNKFYLIRIEGGVEPFIVGPFVSENLRDAIAKRARNKLGEEDALFWADTDEAGSLVVGSYASAFFWPHLK